MSQNHTIVKSTGDTEKFDIEKLSKSLERSNANDKEIAKVTNEVMSWIHEGASTKDIYNKAFNVLRRYKSSSAARYSLKKAIMELGPTGFPFEEYIGQLLKHQGFEIEVGVVVQGQCIQHEVDVVAVANKKQYLVECKFYNTPGKVANVHVPLYIHSRFNDIVKKRSAMPKYKDFEFYCWIVTNTRFTSDAADYGRCAGLHLMSWDYPNGHSLKEMIEKISFYPITALTNLNKNNKIALMKKGIVLCQQIADDPKILNYIGLEGKSLNRLMYEVEDLCEMSI